jgi:predicted PurR-regulated permease PerM
MKERLAANFQHIIFFMLLGIITAFFGYIMQPFFFALFWAVLIAGIFSPLYKQLNKKFKSPNLCASLTLAAIVLCLILPLGLLINLLAVESLDIYKTFDANSTKWINTLTDTFNSLSRHKIFASLNMNHAFVVSKSQEALKAVTEYIINNISGFTQNTIIFFVQFTIMLYSLFFFLRDGAQFLNTVSHYIPVDKRHLNTFLDHFLNTSKASLKFTFVIGGIQGVLGGLIFYITGIERALIWGVLMVGFSIVPAIGCAIIWVPAGLIMLSLGHIWQGVTILLFGSIVISSIDNLLRPVLMGRDIEMHALLIFLSTLGGIAVFGFSGFILGPVIASLFLASWKLLLELYPKKEAIK